MPTSGTGGICCRRRRTPDTPRNNPKRNSQTVPWRVGGNVDKDCQQHAREKEDKTKKAFSQKGGKRPGRAGGHHGDSLPNATPSANISLGGGVGTRKGKTIVMRRESS